MNSSQSKAHGRLPQLDGLRAIAILMVISQHADFSKLGWAGVHLFFVLSGFLITGILRRARKEEHFWAPFYIKRATRILPPLIPFFVICVFTVAINWKKLGLAYIFFGANIAQSLPGVPVTGLTILWSLAVEEHFYLLWPFAIRYLRRKSLLVLLAAILLLEPLARGIATHHVASWLPIYFLTCFQLDGLAAGALLSLLTESDACCSWLRRASGPLAITALVVFELCRRSKSFVREHNTVFFNSIGYSLIALIAVFSLAYVLLRPRSVAARLLSLRPMVFLGAVSYGLYLYNASVMHGVLRWTPMYAPHQGRINFAMALAALGAAIVVSWISFRFYESPIVRWGRRRAAALTAEP